MYLKTRVLTFLAASAMLASAASGQSVIPNGFESRLIETDETTIHAVYEPGADTPVVLLHGWPQDWSEWRHVMPVLAEDYRVVAIDLRGVGESGIATSGFEKAMMADDVIDVLDALEIERAHIVGHDIGGMVAFALAVDHPDRARSISIVDVPIPGSSAFAIISADPRAWHFGFHGAHGLPESLVQGRQEEYFRHFYETLAADKSAITDSDIDRFVEAYSEPERLSAGFGFYRAFAADAEQFTEADLSNSAPILIVGGEFSMGGLGAMTADELRAKGASSVATAIVDGSGHWVSEENPDGLAEALLAFFGSIDLPK